MIVGEGVRHENAAKAVTSSVYANGDLSAFKAALKNDAISNSGDNCKSNRRKQSKPSRVSSGDSGVGGDVNGLGGVGSLHLPDGGHCKDSSLSAECTTDRVSNGSHPTGAAAYRDNVSGTTAADMVNYPCHYCSKVFSSRALQEQHVHEEHISANGRNFAFPTAYHRLASELAAQQAAATTLSWCESAAAPVMATYSFAGTSPSKVVIADSKPSGAAAVFHPEAYCDICQREFCNKYFLKTHRANIHGIYAADATLGKDGQLHAAAPAATKESPKVMVLKKEVDAVPFAGLGVGSGCGVDYTCDICHKPFSSRVYLRKHMVNVHGLLPPAEAEVNSKSEDRESCLTSGKAATGASALVDAMAAESMMQQRQQMVAMAHKWQSVPVVSMAVAAATAAANRFLEVEGQGSHDVESVEQQSPLCLAASAARSAGSPNTTSASSLTSENGGDGSDLPTAADADYDLMEKQSESRALARVGTNDGCQKGMLVSETEQLDGEVKNVRNNGELDDGSRSEASAGSNGRPLSTTTSPVRKRKALEAFAYGPDGFDAAVAARMADRIACDICGKDVCNKYFLKAHKFKMHGVTSDGCSLPLSSVAATALPAEHWQRQSPGVQKADDGVASSHTSRYAESGSPSAAQSAPASVSPAILGITGTCFDQGVVCVKAEQQKVQACADEPSVDSLLALGIDPEAYCTICKKEFCSKYFLRTHKLNMHGIMADGRCKLSPRSSSTAPPSYTPQSGQAASPVAPDSSMIVKGEIYKQWRWKEPANQTRVFCDICNKELCNKYFLRTHKLNKHGITTSASDLSDSSVLRPLDLYCDASSSAKRSSGDSEDADHSRILGPSSPRRDSSPILSRYSQAGALFDGTLGARSSAATSAPLHMSTPLFAAAGGYPPTSLSSAAASNRILGLKFELEHPMLSSSLSLLDAANAERHLQQQLTSEGGGNGPLTTSGFGEAWRILRTHRSGSAMFSGAHQQLTSENGKQPCGMCGMLFSSQDELSRHTSQCGQHLGYGVRGIAAEEHHHQNLYYHPPKSVPPPDAPSSRQQSMLNSIIHNATSAYYLAPAGSGGGKGVLGGRGSSGSGGEKLYSCSHCDYKTPWLSNIYSHEQRKHGGGGSARNGSRSGNVHTCIVCLRTFSYEHSLMRHMAEYHGGGMSGGNGAPHQPVACSSAEEGSGGSHCGGVEGAKSLLPGARVSGHTPLKRRIRCPYCSKHFLNKYLCQSHVRQSHGVCATTAASPLRPPSASTGSGDHYTMYACTTCKFTCRMMSNLRMHQAIKHKSAAGESGALPPTDTDATAAATKSEAKEIVSNSEEVGEKQSPENDETDMTPDREEEDGNCSSAACSIAPSDKQLQSVASCVSAAKSDRCQAILMQPFRIMDVSGSCDFAATTVYLPVYKKVKGNAVVTFTLSSVEN